jgi:homoserine O-acetyltransferase/O-succinyltransferase
MKPQRAPVATRLLLVLAIGTLFCGSGLAQSVTPPAAANNGAPSPWDQQPNAVATKAEASFANYKFRDGEPLDLVNIHYATLGKPHRNAQGVPTASAKKGQAELTPDHVSHTIPDNRAGYSC